MEYLSGGDIFHLMRRKLGFAESELKFYIAEIIIALELIHNDNVIYRDLKPENVMIGGDGHIKIVDFGFTKKLNDIHKDMTYTSWGTQGWIFINPSLNLILVKIF